MPEATNTNTKLLENPVFQIFTIVVVALLAYSNTLHVPFLFDDEGSIQLNTAVHGLTNFFNGGYDNLPNRVVGYLTFAINYHFGELNVVGYHVVNLLIHIINSLLIYFLVRATFRTPQIRNSFSEPHISIFALVVALLFVSHPVQTQAVTYIVQRLTSLSTLFYLVAVISYIQWRFARVDSATFLKGVASPWFALSLVSTVLAMKTKEIAFTIPVIILLYECSFFGWPSRKLLTQMSPLLVTIAIIPYTVYSTISPLIQPGGSLLSDAYNPANNMALMTRWEYLNTQFSVIITYLRLLILPINQNLDYDYPVNHSLFEPKTFISLLFLLLILMLAIYLFFKSKPSNGNDGEESFISFSTSPLYRLASFGIFWFFITLSIESSIITIQDVIFEHRIYLPSFGFFLTAVSFGALALARLKRNIHDINNKAATLIVGLLVVILSGATYARNNVWQSWISIWSDAVSKSPNKPRPHNVLGIGYFYELRLDEAMREYREAARLKPDYVEAYYNMGLIYKARKQYVESINTYLAILSISAFNANHFAKTYNEIGINYAELGELEKAAESFASAVEYNPESDEFRNNYAFALISKGEIDNALREYKMTLSINPGNRYAADAIREIETQKTHRGGKTSIPTMRPTFKKSTAF